MNTTTKVFIIINMLLSLALAYFAMTSFAYQEHWKRRWHQDSKELAEQLNAVKGEIEGHSFNRMQAEQAKVRLAADLEGAQAEIEQHIQTITTKDEDLAIAASDLRSKENTIKAKEKRIESLESSLKIARDRAAELNHIAQVSRAVAFQLNVKLAEVEDDLNNAQTANNRLEMTIQDLEQEAKRKDAYLALVRTNHPRVWTDITTDKVDVGQVVHGIVAAVRKNPEGQQDLVMLTVGEQEEVQEGMEFIVYRDNQYIVKVRAERVLDDMVACRVISDTWNTRGAEIKQGDNAQNRLF
ncbi:MAG: hypothetical protein ACOCYP_00625 [Planctomycetota bacterium]